MLFIYTICITIQQGGSNDGSSILTDEEADRKYKKLEKDIEKAEKVTKRLKEEVRRFLENNPSFTPTKKRKREDEEESGGAWVPADNNTNKNDEEEEEGDEASGENEKEEKIPHGLGKGIMIYPKKNIKN